MVFERINRRRAGQVQVQQKVQGVEREPVKQADVPAPLRIDDVLVDSAVAVSGPRAPPAQGTARETGEFPRSATMRLLLQHPALALGLGVPAAALLLRSGVSRRALRLALRVGAQPELRSLLQLSAAVAAARLDRPPRSDIGESLVKAGGGLTPPG